MSPKQMDNDYMDIDDVAVVEVKPKATPVLKGRKRFAADLAELKDKCKAGLPLSGLTIKGCHPVCIHSVQ